MGDRLTLINSVLDNLPTYLMSLFPIPGKVLKQIDKYRRNFLWEGNSKSHKFHLVKWKKVTQPKFQGGLGIRDLRIHNKSMLMKWLWKYSQEDQVLWKEVVTAKHGIKNHWCTKVSRTPFGVGPWKYISKLGGKFHNCKFKVGNGETEQISSSGKIDGWGTPHYKLNFLPSIQYPLAETQQFQITEPTTHGILNSGETCKTGRYMIYSIYWRGLSHSKSTTRHKTDSFGVIE